MPIHLRNTLLVLGLTSSIFAISLYGQAWADRKQKHQTAVLLKGVGGACLPFMVLSLAYAVLGLRDHHRSRD